NRVGLCLAVLAAAAAERGSALETALSFRLKLALAAGFAPELASCARCGEAEHLTGFSGAAGGVVCSGCEAGSFALSEEGHRFMVVAIAQPLAEAPAAAAAAPPPAGGGGPPTPRRNPHAPLPAPAR